MPPEVVASSASAATAATHCIVDGWGGGLTEVPVVGSDDEASATAVQDREGAGREAVAVAQQQQQQQQGPAIGRAHIFSPLHRRCFAVLWCAALSCLAHDVMLGGGWGAQHWHYLAPLPLLNERTRVRSVMMPPTDRPASRALRPLRAGSLCTARRGCGAYLPHARGGRAHLDNVASPRFVQLFRLEDRATAAAAADDDDDDDDDDDAAPAATTATTAAAETARAAMEQRTHQLLSPGSERGSGGGSGGGEAAASELRPPPPPPHQLVNLSPDPARPVLRWEGFLTAEVRGSFVGWDGVLVVSGRLDVLRRDCVLAYMPSSWQCARVSGRLRSRLVCPGGGFHSFPRLQRWPGRIWYPVCQAIAPAIG
jgi:hypothetical protein